MKPRILNILSFHSLDINCTLGGVNFQCKKYFTTLYSYFGTGIALIKLQLKLRLLVLISTKVMADSQGSVYLRFKDAVLGKARFEPLLESLYCVLCLWVKHLISQCLSP